MKKRFIRRDGGSSPKKEKVRTNRPDHTIETICPDFQEWPDSWKGEDKDVPYGKGLIEAFRPFIQYLIAQPKNLGSRVYSF
jgi:hypothetical protein